MFNPNILFFVLLAIQAVAGNALTNAHDTPAGQASPYYYFPTWQRTPFDNTYGPRTSYPEGATYRTFQLTIRNTPVNNNTSPFYGTSFDDEISNTTTIRRDDLECKDYQPRGWTTNEARVWVYSDPDTYPVCEGANTCSCSPWQLAEQVPRTTPASKPPATGAVYTMSHCNSTVFNRPSGLYLENTCFDAIAGRACHYNTLHFIQLKDSQGRCLTHEFYDAPATKMVWRPCEYDNYDHSQHYAVIEHVRCYTSDETKPHGCGDSLPPRVYMFPRFTMAGEARHWNFKFDFDDEKVLSVVEGDPLDTTLTVLLGPYAPLAKRNSWDRRFRARPERTLQLD